jgi:hypothetical protein
MDWKNIKRFNFTWAITNGAWLEDANGCRSWESFTTIAKYKDDAWIERQIRKQGQFTGCWITVTD